MKKVFLALGGICWMGLTFAQTDLIKAHKQFAKKMKYYSFIDHPEQPYFLSCREVTNLDYFEFLYAIEEEFGRDSSNQLVQDTALWLEAYPTDVTMMNYYHNHPAYHAYPVVNISHEKAQSYCRWLEKVLNENEDLDFARYEVSLPSEEEWIHAASGRYLQSEYPWYGDKLKDAKGEYICNFNAVDQQDIALNENKELIVLPDTTVYWHEEINIYPTMAFEDYTNDLFDMGGNVAEFVAEKGITKGGSYLDPGHYLLNSSRKLYEDDGAAINHGFRVMVTLKEKPNS